MNRIKCGHCKKYHDAVYQVRRCANRQVQARANTARVIAIADAKRAAVEQPTPGTAGVPARGKWLPAEWQFTTPRAMVEHMREGRYAVEIKLPGKPTDWVFIRVSRPTHGQKKGCLVLQTQHSDYYKMLLQVYPSGHIYTAQYNEKLDMALMMVAADPFTAAINYGRELGCCSRCARKLTDERSRYYSIGPECEKYWPEIINYLNETRGVFVP